MLKYERIRVESAIALVLTDELSARIVASAPDACSLLTGQDAFPPGGNPEKFFLGLSRAEYAYAEFYKAHPDDAAGLKTPGPFGLTDTSLAAFLIERHARMAFGRPLRVREIALFDGHVAQLYPESPDGPGPDDDAYIPELNGRQVRSVLRYIDVADLACLKVTVLEFLAAQGLGRRPLLAPEHEHRVIRFLAALDGTGIDLALESQKD